MQISGITKGGDRNNDNNLFAKNVELLRANKMLFQALLSKDLPISTTFPIILF